MRAVELVPTELEARRLVASITVFWLAGGLWPVDDAITEDYAPIGLAVVLIALAAGTVFYWVLYTVGARETGRSARDYMGFRLPRLRGSDNMFAIGAEAWSILLRSLDPRWWARVIRTTGWPFGLTAVVLLVLLVWILVPLFVLWG